ncbi:hypothetical protein JZN58_004319 [Vibrio vulnificus]|nr:hypothetical protein [Vibrio vulnificus]
MAFWAWVKFSVYGVQFECRGRVAHTLIGRYASLRLSSMENTNMTSKLDSKKIHSANRLFESSAKKLIITEEEMKLINEIIKRNDEFVEQTNLEKKLAAKAIKNNGSSKFTKIAVKKRKRAIKAMNQKSGLNNMKSKLVQGGGPGLGKKA